MSFLIATQWYEEFFVERKNARKVAPERLENGRSLSEQQKIRLFFLSTTEKLAPILLNVAGECPNKDKNQKGA